MIITLGITHHDKAIRITSVDGTAVGLHTHLAADDVHILGRSIPYCRNTRRHNHTALMIDTPSRSRANFGLTPNYPGFPLHKHKKEGITSNV